LPRAERAPDRRGEGRREIGGTGWNALADRGGEGYKGGVSTPEQSDDPTSTTSVACAPEDPVGRVDVPAPRSAAPETAQPDTAAPGEAVPDTAAPAAVVTEPPAATAAHVGRGGRVVGAVLAVLAVATIAVNLRPGATGVGPLMEPIVAAYGQGPAASGLLTALPCLAFGALGLLAVPI